MYDEILQRHASNKPFFDEKAVTDPEQYGREWGQLTGQPLTTYGIAKASPTATKLAGYPTELIGRTMAKHTPLSTMTGVGVGASMGGIPGAIVGTMKPSTRILRAIERPTGRMIESVGKSMKNVGKSSVGKELTSDILNEAELTEGQDITPPKKFKVINQENVINKVKPKVRLNADGTFTDMNTGEVLDSKGQPIIEYNGKPISKDSPFCLKNRPNTTEMNLSSKGTLPKQDLPLFDEQGKIISGRELLNQDMNLNDYQNGTQMEIQRLW